MNTQWIWQISIPSHTQILTENVEAVLKSFATFAEWVLELNFYLKIY